jgi:hypothetical protein
MPTPHLGRRIKAVERTEKVAHSCLHRSQARAFRAPATSASPRQKGHNCGGNNCQPPDEGRRRVVSLVGLRPRVINHAKLVAYWLRPVGDY